MRKFFVKQIFRVFALDFKIVKTIQCFKANIADFLWQLWCFKDLKKYFKMNFIKIIQCRELTLMSANSTLAIKSSLTLNSQSHLSFKHNRHMEDNFSSFISCIFLEMCKEIKTRLDRKYFLTFLKV